MPREYFGSYAWDADNNQAHLEKHGWSFQSAAIALEHGRPVLVSTRADGREEHIASLNSEAIKVVIERHGSETHIVSAHKNRNLAKEYDAKAAEQGVVKNRDDNADFAAWRALDEKLRGRANKEPREAMHQAHAIERQALDQRVDLSPEQRAQLRARQNDQHKLQAQQERQPRLWHATKVREQLARQQGTRQRDRQAELIERERAEAQRSPTATPRAQDASTRDQDTSASSNRSRSETNAERSARIQQQTQQAQQNRGNVRDTFSRKR